MLSNNFTVVVSGQAALEAFEVAAWYEEKAPLLGDHFLEALNVDFKKIASNPEAFALYSNTKIRRHVLTGFPYKVFYIVEKEEVRIISIIHTSRSKGFIRKRLEP